MILSWLYCEQRGWYIWALSGVGSVGFQTGNLQVSSQGSALLTFNLRIVSFSWTGTFY